MSLVAEQVINGISMGSRLFLVAVGLSLIFGVMKVLNFAHGALYMLGAYGTITISTSVANNFWVGLIGGALLVGVVGAIIEAGFIRRLYDREDVMLDQLLLTFAFILIITDSLRYYYGSGALSMDPPASLRGNLDLVVADVTIFRLFVIALAVVIMAVMYYVLQYTYYGKLVRATSSDREMAELLGINVKRTFTGVFFVGSVLAGIGGALAAPLQAVNTALGNAVIIDAFIVAVIGGLGSFPGALVGAMVIGLLRGLGIMLFSAADLLLPFLAMVLVLIFKPEGLFGEGGVGE